MEYQREILTALVRTVDLGGASRRALRKKKVATIVAGHASNEGMATSAARREEIRLRPPRRKQLRLCMPFWLPNKLAG